MCEARRAEFPKNGFPNGGTLSAITLRAVSDLETTSFDYLALT
jgi:hypothetical protein